MGQAQSRAFSGKPLHCHGLGLRLEREQLLAGCLIAGQHDDGNIEITGNGRHLSNLAHRPRIEKDVLDGEALGVCEDTLRGARHCMLPHEHDPVIQPVLQIVARGGRPPLDQLRAAVNFVDGKRTASIVPVPYDCLTGSALEGAFHSGIDFASKQPARFLEASLAGKQLLVGVIHSADALEVGDNHDPGSFCDLERACHCQPENELFHAVPPSLMSAESRTRLGFYVLSSGHQLPGCKHDQAPHEPAHQGPDGRSQCQMGSCMKPGLTVAARSTLMPL